MDRKGRVGFGGYRISQGDAIHEQALRMALDSGCSLIDTSSNYTNGMSEFLIGNVLEDYDKKPVIVTKGGYIQGTNVAILRDLQCKGLALDEVVEISKELKHSINPEFLDSQISLSSKRMEIESLDVFLLHNPEYYFEDKGATREEYYRRVANALSYLESQVEAGRIKSYGISSNTFTLKDNKSNGTNLEKIISIVKEHKLAGFKYIQFPFNIIERDCLEVNSAGKNLIEVAHDNGLITMSNRPFNAFVEGTGIVRLADYRCWIPDESEDELQVSDLYALLFTALSDNLTLTIHDIKGSDGLTAFSKFYKTVDSSDTLELLFNKHLIPAVRTLSDDNIPEPVIEVIRDLYRAMDRDICKKISVEAHGVVQETIKGSDIELDTTKELTCSLVEYYISCGIDYVLCGMRHPNYVEQLKYLF